MSGTLYKGTTFIQDGRFKNKEKKMIENKTYHREYEVKILIDKIEMKVIKDWVDKSITKILGFEDEFLVNFVMNLLENQADDPRKIELQLKGFLTDSTEIFMKELWSLLIQAQNSESGIPEVLLKEKEDELKAKSEKNLEKVKFLEKMLGDKETKFEKFGETKKKEEKLDLDNKSDEYKKKENSSKKYSDVKKEKNDTKEENKDRKYEKYRQEKGERRLDNYKFTKKRKSPSSNSRSSSRSRSRSRNKDRKRNDKYRDDKSSRYHREHKYRDRYRESKRDNSYDKDRNHKLRKD